MSCAHRSIAAPVRGDTESEGMTPSTSRGVSKVRVVKKAD
jgi:hypothetical protein